MPSLGNSFTIGERCKVFDEYDEPVAPGSGKMGFIAMPSPIPLGYHKDEAKTAKTFRTIGGVRYSIPGDWCLVEPDGTTARFDPEVLRILRPYVEGRKRTPWVTIRAWGDAQATIGRPAPSSDRQQACDTPPTMRHVR